MSDSNPRNILRPLPTAEARRQRYSETGRITEADVLEYLGEVRKIQSKYMSGDELEDYMGRIEKKTRTEYAKELAKTAAKPKKKKIKSKRKIESTDSVLVADKDENISKVSTKDQEKAASASMPPSSMFRDLAKSVGSGTLALGSMAFNKMFPTLGRFMNAVAGRIASQEQSAAETNASSTGFAQQVGRSSVFLNNIAESQMRSNELLQQILNVVSGGSAASLVPSATQAPPPGTPPPSGGSNPPPAAGQQQTVPGPRAAAPTGNAPPATQTTRPPAVTGRRLSSAAGAAGGLAGGTVLASSMQSSSGSSGNNSGLEIRATSSSGSDASPVETEDVVPALPAPSQSIREATRQNGQSITEQQEADLFANRILNIKAKEIIFKADRYEFDQAPAAGGMASSMFAPSAGSSGAVLTSPPPPAGFTGGTGDLLRPTAGQVTSGFGQRSMGNHQGMDFGVPIGSPIVSSQSGTVIEARSSSSYGNMVRIRGNDGVETLYAHLSTVGVQQGQQVQRGQQIALSGNTGRSTGPHLHFETIRDGQRVDPAPLINATGEAPRPIADQGMDAPLSAPPAASPAPSTPSSGAQVAQASVQSEVATMMSQQISMPQETQTAAPSNAGPTDPASTMIDPNDPGPVEPPDAAQRYARLFNLAA